MQHLYIPAQALDSEEELWRMHAPVRDAAAALSAELGLRHCAARRGLGPAHGALKIKWKYSLWCRLRHWSLRSFKYLAMFMEST